MPPLRQRLAELPGELDIMVRHTVHRTLGEDAPEMVSLALEAIQRQLGPAYAWPGNVRELEQCVRRILLKRHYGGDRETAVGDLRGELFRGIDAGELDASALLEGYCALLYRRHGSYEQVARRTKLDRRTVRKYVQRWSGGGETADDDQAE